MSKKKLIQLIAIVFLITAVLLLIPNTNWSEKTSVLGFVSLVCGTLGSIIAIFIPTTYSFTFTTADWHYNEQERDYSLIIKSKVHGIGPSIITQVFENNENGFTEIAVESNHDHNRNVYLKVNRAFSGKAVIS